jgi:hypothetical protein
MRGPICGDKPLTRLNLAVLDFATLSGKGEGKNTRIPVDS